MHRIEALISGIRGAESGTVSLYQRGTSTPVTCYTDFEGTSTFSGASVSLDAYGGAVVFVNELVRVVARSAAGATVREWVAGDAATAVELRSLSATGAAYSGGALAPGNPTTVKAWADSWVASAGAPDFEVLLNGAAVDLETAFSGVAGLRYFVVTDDTYGAVGDGLTNDLGPVQAAINAANAAAGGIVFFPPGTYLINGTLTTYSTVELRGYSADLSIIRVQSGSATLLSGDAPYCIRDLSIRFSAVEYTGFLMSFSGPALISDSILLSNVVMIDTDVLSGTFLRFTGAGVPTLTATFENCSLKLLDNGVACSGTYLRPVWRDGRIFVGINSGAMSGSIISSSVAVEIDGLDVSVQGGTSGTKNIIDAPSIISTGLFLSTANSSPSGTIIFYTASPSGTIIEQSTRYAHQSETVLLYSGFQTSTFMDDSGGQYGSVQLGSRAHAWAKVSADVDPCVIVADQARYVEARVTSTAGWAGNCNVDINQAPRGSDVIVSFWNDTGAPVTFVWGANVSITAATTFAVAANSFRTFHLVSGSNSPTSYTLEWFLVSSTAGAEVVE